MEGRLADAAKDRAVLLDVRSARAAEETCWDGKSPVVASPRRNAFQEMTRGFGQFRDCFPLYVSFPNVIPNDEVVSLKMFHREDEPLTRLFLGDQEARRLDRLWTEHRFISRQPIAENNYLPLFIGFVTQDQPKEMVAYFESQRPRFALEPTHLKRKSRLPLQSKCRRCWILLLGPIGVRCARTKRQNC